MIVFDNHHGSIKDSLLSVTRKAVLFRSAGRWRSAESVKTIVIDELIREAGEDE